MRLSCRVVLASFALVLVSASAVACSPKETSADLIEAQGDAAVDAARVEAARTVDVFWAKFEAKPADITGYSVKLAMKAPDGGTEFIWAEPISRDATVIAARLQNDPVHVPDMKYGSIVRVSPSQISDWTYEKNGKLYGHFTTRALMSRATPEQRAQVEGRFSPTPLEPDAK